eukprot:CAMPEP_0202918298 /NCGR_PEP_ID=MMETSP1392-20130828/73134_1 /ASSEMBLY_ACC=CAM_ASM_000868 /TAXON_ID=225041 /ORGANISM="Chlamydomonas chlamydogama, Strain SAG 11-48b" /LENGTH=41 /DNA_ID= /DNA_START= /DNA_END= /DNA_ORIENTATION=
MTSGGLVTDDDFPQTAAQGERFIGCKVRRKFIDGLKARWFE